MADLGITNFEEFDFIAPPEKSGLIGGIETLNLLDALEKDRSLSKTGKLMTEFPLAPRQSRIIVEAILRYPDVLRETIIAAAFLSTQSPYILPPGEETDARQAHHRFRDDHGDFVSYLKLFRAYNDSTNKTKFCEKNYLDEKAMAEIVNVTIQLEEIVSSLKIPIHQRTVPLESSQSGGDISDYLYCVARGMIQFVCVLEGHGRNSSYRSLTADKIIIHPGSVMFRSDPYFIAAGEIVKTSRTYAMSVSPLSWEIIERLGLENNPEFAERKQRIESSGGGHSHKEARKKEDGRKSGQKPKKARDFTNNIKIGDEVFEIETIKGKKTVLLPWEKLVRIGEKTSNWFAGDSVYKGLKGKIIVKNRFNLLAGEKLELILALAPTLDAESAFIRTYPRKENFNSKENLALLLDHLDDLARPVVWKKDSVDRKFNDLGFLGLFTDGDGNYWFRASRGFHTSVNESLSSLEALIDELGEDIAIEQKHIVNQCYRRLSDYLR